VITLAILQEYEHRTYNRVHYVYLVWPPGECLGSTCEIHNADGQESGDTLENNIIFFKDNEHNT
jgi:hypothetical protein